tara:strand:- start:92 stop:1120 length:1029 start_codon:yes stop_codon:yes gene_type:complete
MPIKKWILPEGIEDILPEQAYWLEIKRREVIDNFIASGYGLVIPPLIEYHDSLLSNSSEDLDLQTFKLIDQDTGKQLGLRADITSQISRIYTSYSNKDEINRYCYFDHVVRTKSKESKGSRIPIQAGAELIGNSDIKNDAELVILMLDTVKIFSTKKIYLDLGHFGVFKKLINYASLQKDQEKQIKKLIRSKSTSEIKKYINNLEVDDSFKSCICNFPKMHGSIKDIQKDLNVLKVFNSEIEKDINYMINICDLVEKKHSDVEIKYDFCELQGFDYENDIVFSVYIENDTEEVAIGGKYDFDEEGFSGIGFSVDVKYLIKNQSIDKKLVNKYGKWVIEDSND